MRYLIRGSFDAGHRLHDYLGKCANLHGHTYHVEVYIKAPHTQMGRRLAEKRPMPGDSGLGGSNRPVDFKALTGILQAHLEVADHATWLSQESCILLFHSDPPASGDGETFTIPPGLKIVVTVGEPTAEKMAQILYDWLAPDYRALGTKAGEEITLEGVTVWETECQGVTYAPDM